MGFHLAVHAGVHQHLSGVHRAPACHLGVEGQLAGGDRTGAGQPGACRRDRRPAGHVRQSVLRQDERPHLLAAGRAAAVDGHRPGGRFSRHPRGRAGPQHRGGPRRMVPRPAVLQRTARRHGGSAARPGPGRSTRPGRRCPGGLYAHRVGERHLRGQAVHRQPARRVPGPVRDRRVFHPALRSHAERPPAGQGGQAHLVTAGIRQHILSQSVRKNPDFAWAFVSRFMFVLAYAFLVTYQAYYLLEKIGSAKADIPQQIFLGTLVQSVVVVAASLIGGKLSDRTGRRKIFVLTASVVYGVAIFVIAIASNFNGFLVGMAIDVALVVDVLPDKDNAAKDLGVFNMAGALPFSIAPGIAPAILAIGGGSYAVLYAVAGVSAIVGAATILPVNRVR